MHIECDRHKAMNKKEKKNNFQIPNVNVLWRRQAEKQNSMTIAVRHFV